MLVCWYLLLCVSVMLKNPVNQVLAGSDIKVSSFQHSASVSSSDDIRVCVCLFVCLCLNMSQSGLAVLVST